MQQFQFHLTLLKDLPEIVIEFKRFLEIATGSAFELETQLIIMEDQQFISKEKFRDPKEKLQIEQKMIIN